MTISPTSAWCTDPAFRALHAAWRHGDEIFAEVRLPDDTPHNAERFGLHPAALDASTHALWAVGGRDGGAGRVPFSWSGVELHAGRRLGAAGAVRAARRPTGSGWT